jgi:hypothetical protein
VVGADVGAGLELFLSGGGPQASAPASRITTAKMGHRIRLTSTNPSVEWIIPANQDS